MFCDKCGKENSDDAKFCFNCGNRLDLSVEKSDEEVIEEVEGEIVDEETASEETAVVEQASVDIEEKMVSTDESKPKKKKLGWVIALIAAGIFVFWLVNSEMIFKQDNEYPIAYLKEGGIFVRDEKKEKPVEIAQNITKEDADVLDMEDSYFSLAKVTQDGKGMFYLSNIKEDGEADLYYSDITYNKIKNKTDENIGTEVAKNIDPSHFEISKDGKYVAYLKDIDGSYGSLYVSDLKKGEKIDSNVGIDFVFSNDCKSILYCTHNDSEYDDECEYWIKSLDGDDEGEKLDSGIKDILLYTPNFEKVYYTKLDTYYDDIDCETAYIYVKEKGKDKTKIASDIAEVNSINENGDMVYSKVKEVSLKFNDITDDDLASSDANMEYPDRYDYEIDDGLFTSYDYDAYYDAGVEYKEKLYRDEIREELSEWKVPYCLFDIHSYDSKEGEEEKIAIDVVKVIDSSDDAKGVLYLKSAMDKIKKIKMSEIDTDEAIEDFFKNSFESVDIFIITNIEEIKEPKKIATVDSFENMDIKTDFKNVYSNEKDDDGSRLIMYSIEDPSDKQVIDKDVIYYEIVGDSKVVYKKAKDDLNRDLYLKHGERKEKIVDNVNFLNTFIDEEKGIILCLEDYNSDKQRGRLVKINNFEKTVLAEDVHDFFYRNLDNILFMTDYSESKDKGDLWLYNGKEKNIKIDNDVTRVLAY